jgi:ankyrin repeat protein
VSCSQVAKHPLLPIQALSEHHSRSTETPGMTRKPSYAEITARSLTPDTSNEGTNAAKRITLTTLPDDVLSIVCGFLQIQEILRLARVNKTLYQIVKREFSLREKEYGYALRKWLEPGKYHAEVTRFVSSLVALLVSDPNYMRTKDPEKAAILIGRLKMEDPCPISSKNLLVSAGAGNWWFIRHLLDWADYTKLIDPRNPMARSLTIEHVQSRDKTVLFHFHNHFGNKFKELKEYLNFRFLKAANQKNYNLMIVTLELGANVNVQDQKDSKFPTALMKMIKAQNPAMAHILIKLGADIHTKNDAGMDSLLLAIENGDIVTIKLLAALGAKIDTKNNEGQNVVLHALVSLEYQENVMEVIKLLALLGADLHFRDPYGTNALMLAAYFNQKEAAKFFLDKGINIHVRNNGGKNALIFAAEQTLRTGHNAAFKLLVSRGANFHTCLPTEFRMSISKNTLKLMKSLTL